MMRFEINTNVIADRRSGLMWSRDAALAEYPLTWAEGLAWITDLNRSGLAGFHDWRLPNRRELFSLISHEAINPSLPDGHPFLNVFTGYYWTSTTVCRLPDQAWYVHLGGARIFKGMKSGSYMVWPVRNTAADPLNVLWTGQHRCYSAAGDLIECAGSAQDGEFRIGLAWPVPRFEIQGAVTADRLTGLTWTLDADQAPGPVTWETAGRIVSEVNSSKLHGFTDWRLPNIRELESLCDMQHHSPALPQGHPFTAVADFYWSGTTSRYDRDYAWALYALDGNVGVGYKPGTGFHVWLVRGPSAQREPPLT
jgi:hypothetical protein